MCERDCEPPCLNINLYVCVHRIYKLNTKRRSDVMRVNGSIIAHLKRNRKRNGAEHTNRITSKKEEESNGSISGGEKTK